MHKYILVPILILSTLLAFGQKKEKYPTIAIGSSLPMADYEMQDVSGESFAMAELMKSNGLLIIFSCNTCPFVVGSGESNEGWDGRYKEIYEWCDENEIGFALVNPNEAKRDLGDAFDDMVARSEEMEWDCKHLLDENSKLANAFGGKTTPHAFLFNAGSELVYEGAIDDNHKSAEAVESHYLIDAMTNLLEGKDIDPQTTNAVGCSIKRVM
jgi:hypothetical protein